MIGLLISGCQGAFATQCTIPTIYQTNGQVTAVNLNGNFSACQGTVNGNLDNTNANTSQGYRFYQTVSSLPSAGNQGAVYFLTSDNSLNFDTGSTFVKTLAVSGSPSQGNVVIYGASGLAYAATGTSGQPFISQGASANPIFGNISAAGTVSGAAITSASSLPSGAGLWPTANIGGLLGSWVSKSGTTVYQAATDGFVSCNGTAAGGTADNLEVLTDSNSMPSTIRVNAYAPATETSGIVSPVKKNDYWECVWIGSGSPTFSAVYFLSLGS